MNNSKRSTLRPPAAAKARIAANYESREALAKTPVSPSSGGKSAAGGPIKKHKAVRIARLQIGDVDGGVDTLKRWHELGGLCRDIANTIHNQWIVFHERNGSFGKLQAWIKAAREWHESESKGSPKPKCPVVCSPPDFQNSVRVVLNERFSQVNARVKDLVLNTVLKNLKSRSAAFGSLGAWQCVLLGREALPTSTRPHPIPFDTSNSNLNSWNELDGEWQATVRIDRVSMDGKKKACSTLDTFKLRTRSRKAITQRLILERIKSGEYKFCGSSIQWRESDRKWYLLLAYQMPIKVATALEPEKVATLKATADHPWSLEIDGREIWIGGRGEYVAATRRNLCRQRVSRQNAYRHAGSANKGHGHKRAQAPYFRLTRRWKDFVKTLNHNVTTRAVALAVEHRCGTIVYEQPIGSSERFLSSAGKSDEMRDSTGWDWYQVLAQLNYKCQNVGIKVKVEKQE